MDVVFKFIFRLLIVGLVKWKNRFKYYIILGGTILFWNAGLFLVCVVTFGLRTGVAKFSANFSLSVGFVVPLIIGVVFVIIVFVCKDIDFDATIASNVPKRPHEMGRSDQKYAVAVLLSGKVFIQAYAKVGEDLWISRGPYVVDAGHLEELGEKIQQALNMDEDGTNHSPPGHWKAVQEPLLEAVGVQNWRELAQMARSVGMLSTAGMVKMAPPARSNHPGRPSLSEKQAIWRKLSDPALGGALMDALQSDTA